MKIWLIKEAFYFITEIFLERPKWFIATAILYVLFNVICNVLMFQIYVFKLVTPSQHGILSFNTILKWNSCNDAIYPPTLVSDEEIKYRYQVVSKYTILQAWLRNEQPDQEAKFYDIHSILDYTVCCCEITNSNHWSSSLPVIALEQLCPLLPKLKLCSSFFTRGWSIIRTLIYHINRF